MHDEPQVAARDRIDAERRLVEEQQLGLVDQRAGQAQLLLHPAGQLARQAIPKRAEPGEPEQPVQSSPSFLGRHVVQVGVEIEVLLHGEVRVQAESLGHVGDAGLRRLRIRRQALAQHDRVPARGPKHARQHTERGGLAGPIRPDETEQLPPTDLEAELVDRGHVRESTNQPVETDGGFGGGRFHQESVSRSRTSAGMPGFRS